ncbi:MAG TPA: serine O-acetyltransferase, partial [Halomonas sp.]|nr:serine O-acetyltransferase [Halomonas sp.]
FGFDAYGVSEDMPDPVARSMQAMFDHIHAMDERIEQMSTALSRVDASFHDHELPTLRNEDFADMLADDEPGSPRDAGSGTDGQQLEEVEPRERKG